MRWPWLLLLAGCSVSRGIKPLDVGETAITGSFGGPIVDRDGPFPLPLMAVGVGHGVSDKTTVHGALHLTQLGLFGVFGMEAGAYTELVQADGARPRITADGTLLLFAGDNEPGGAKGGTRLFEDIAVLAVWDLGDRHHVWTGVDTMFQLFPEVHALPTPVVGTEIGLSDGFGVQLEAKWAGFWHDTDVGFIRYYAPGNQGSLYVQLGLRGRFGGAR